MNGDFKNGLREKKKYYIIIMVNLLMENENMI